MTSRCAIFIILARAPTQWGGRGEMVRMPYLRTTVVDFTSETCPVIVSYDACDNATMWEGVKNGVWTTVVDFSSETCFGVVSYIIHENKTVLKLVLFSWMI